MNLSQTGKIGLRTMVYYLSITVLAVILGIVLAVTIRPGERGSLGDVEKIEDQDPVKKKNVTTADTLMDLLRNSFPPNIVQATTQQFKTLIIYPGEEIVSTLSGNLCKLYTMRQIDFVRAPPKKFFFYNPA